MSKAVDIIKYEGDNSTFVWKHPNEDFSPSTELIVHESQEAIFFLDGEALDIFGPGRYSLANRITPKAVKQTEDGIDENVPFHCEVYFINKTIQMSVKWGTDNKIRFLEPSLGIPVEIGACGEMNLAVSDSRKLLIKLVGTMHGIAWEKEGEEFTKSIQNSFRPLISTAVKTHLINSIKSQYINILEIDENLESLSETLRLNIIPGFEEFGLTIPQFYITTIVLPEKDPNFRRMMELHTIELQTKMAEAEAIVKSAQASAEAEITAARRKVEVEKQFTETEIAKFEAERNLIRAKTDAQAIKIAGLAEAEVMQAKGSDADSYTTKCVKCGSVILREAKFCSNCGEKNEFHIACDKILCPSCGNMITKGKFCSECGQKL